MPLENDELHRKYRPTRFADMVGQKEAIAVLQQMGRRGSFPQFLLLTGPSGCGKTTIARILKEKLNCGDRDFMEVNAAKERGIDMVRGIEQHWGYNPTSGDCRIWLVDEAHALTADAQGSFLKMLEEPKKFVRFIFCTTNPEKLKRTIRTRASTIDLKAVGRKDLKELIDRVWEKETGGVLSDEVCSKIIDICQGSPRQALVLLHPLVGLEDEDSQLECLSKSDTQKDAIEICRLMMSPRASWKDMANVLNSIEGLDEQCESIRFLVLSYMSSVLLKGGKMAGRAADIINLFKENFYDSKRAGLILACYDALVSDKD